MFTLDQRSGCLLVMIVGPYYELCTLDELAMSTMKTVRVAVCVLHILLVEVHSQTEYPYISFMGKNLTNHSYVDLTLVGSSDSHVLMCRTDLMSCCRQSDIHQGHWYSPNGQKLPKQSDDDRFLYVKHLVKRVELKKNGSSQAGIYHCDIPTTNTSHDGNESVVIHNTIYVGLYNGGGIIM